MWQILLNGVDTTRAFVGSFNLKEGKESGLFHSYWLGDFSTEVLKTSGIAKGDSIEIYYDNSLKFRGLVLSIVDVKSSDIYQVNIISVQNKILNSKIEIETLDIANGDSIHEMLVSVNKKVKEITGDLIPDITISVSDKFNFAPLRIMKIKKLSKKSEFDVNAEMLGFYRHPDYIDRLFIIYKTEYKFEIHPMLIDSGLFLDSYFSVDRFQRGGEWLNDSDFDEIFDTYNAKDKYTRIKSTVGKNNEMQDVVKDEIEYYLNSIIPFSLDSDGNEVEVEVEVKSIYVPTLDFNILKNMYVYAKDDYYYDKKNYYILTFSHEDRVRYNYDSPTSVKSILKSLCYLTDSVFFFNNQNNTFYLKDRDDLEYIQTNSSDYKKLNYKEENSLYEDVEISNDLGKFRLFEGRSTIREYEYVEEDEVDYDNVRRTHIRRIAHTSIERYSVPDEIKRYYTDLGKINVTYISFEVLLNADIFEVGKVLVEDGVEIGLIASKEIDKDSDSVKIEIEKRW